MKRRLGLASAFVLTALVLVAAPASAAEVEVPVAAPGAPLPADGPPASLMRPATLHATFRVPPSADALYVGTPWFVRDLSVTIVGPGAPRRTIVAKADLPGAMLGLRLPPDASRADRIELQATAVSSVASPYLLSGDQLARIAARSWWYAACFGVFLTLALAGGLAACALRSRLAGWFALASGAQAGLLIPWLGIVRPPPDASQPLHALLESLAYAALAMLALRFAGDGVPRWARAALGGVVAVNVVAAWGGDVLQDLWPVPDAASQTASAVLGAALVALAAFAAQRRVPGAPAFVAGTAIALATTIAGALPTTPVELAQAAPLLGSIAARLLMACALVLWLRAHDAARSRTEAGAAVDGLTGMPNRAAFEERLASAWRDARRRGEPVGALLVDVDQLHAFNDCYGHLAGDDLLRRIAEAIAPIAARERAFACRYGGEEFALLLARADATRVRDAGETVRAAVAALDIAHGGVPSKRLTVSAGAASLLPHERCEPSDLLRRASDALYVAKSMGRNRVVVDEPVTAYASKTESAKSSLTAYVP